MTTLTPDLMLDAPQIAGSLAVFPVLGLPGDLAYRSFAQALELGAFVKELDGGASVGDLLVGNPTDQPVLVFEGEEVLGAQQNRSFDVSVLVPAGEHLQVPVSCVERGRWDGGRLHEHFAPSPQAADPALRRAKRGQVNAHAATGAPARADQAAVWHTVDSRLQAHGTVSDSSALHDGFEARRGALMTVAGAFRPVSDQLGALALVSGRPVALDVLSRPEVFADLLPRLVQGYALEALDQPLEGSPVALSDRAPAERFLAAALHAPRRAVPAPGLGEGFAVTTAAVVGGGVTCDRELVHLSAFRGERVSGGRIARPRLRRS